MKSSTYERRTDIRPPPPVGGRSLDEVTDLSSAENERETNKSSPLALASFKHSEGSTNDAGVASTFHQMNLCAGGRIVHPWDNIDTDPRLLKS